MHKINRNKEIRGYKQSPVILSKLDKNFNFPIILNGGDVTPSVASDVTVAQDIINYLIDGMDSFGVLNNKMLYSVGNHETQLNSVSVDSGILQPYLFGRNRNAMLAPAYSNTNYANGKPLYGYVDDPQLKIRYISLNYMDTPDGHFWTWGISQKQLDWLGNTALHMPANGWHAVILIHNGILYTDNTDSNWFANADPLYDLLSHAYTGASYTLASHSEANSGGTVNFPITNLNITFPYAVPIVAVFCGHYHANSAFDAKTGGTNGMTAYTHNSQVINLVHVEFDSLKSVKSQCFDIAVIDKVSKTVYLKHVGTGSDRSFTY
jgi:hypothetical protein